MTARQEAEELTRVTYERIRVVEAVRIVIDDGAQQLRLPGLDEPVPLNVIDGDEARRMLDNAEVPLLPAAGERS